MRAKIATARARLVPNFTLSWRDGAACRALEPVRRAGDLPHRQVLAAGRTTAFDFIAPAAALDRLCIEFARQPWPTCAASLEIADREGTVLRRWPIPALAIRSGGLTPVAELHEMQFEPGARYTVRLTAMSRSPFASVTLRASPDPDGGGAFHNHILGLCSERARVSATVPRSAHVAVFPKGAGLDDIEADLGLLARAFPGARFAGIFLDGLDTTWPAVADAEVVAFAGAPVPAGQRTIYDQLCFALYRRGACTIALDPRGANPWPLAGGAVDRLHRQAEEDRRRCRFILRQGQPPALALAHDPARAWLEGPALGTPETLGQLVDLAGRAAAPRIAVILLADGPAPGLRAALERLRSQSWPASRMLLAVAEDSEQDRQTAEAAVEAVFGAGDDRAVVVGGPSNPVARFAHVAASEPAEIYLLLDGPWLVNRDFLAAHLLEHLAPSVQAVVSAPVLRAEPGEHSALVESLDKAPETLSARARWEDPVQTDSFVNLASSPFSIKRPALLPNGGPGAEAWPNLAEPQLGWSRISLGYRLYLEGGRIQSTDHAIALAPPGAPGEEILAPAGAIRLAAGRRDFAPSVRRWLASIGALETDLSQGDPAAPFIGKGGQRPLRVLSYRWHVAHQYELYKLPHAFTLATNAGENHMINQWDFEQRPLRPNVRLRPASQIDPADFDVAIVHFDENVLAPELCNGAVPQAWGDPFRWLMSLPLPKVAICHGTPQFIGQYGVQPGPIDRFEIHEAERRRLVAVMNDTTVVCNSHQALAEWGFTRGQVIWHGFDPNEFPPGRGDLDVLALGGDWRRPHYRGAWEEMEVRGLLRKDIQIETARHDGGACEIRDGNAYAIARFRSYAARLGRFKAYLNTTRRSPMPRSRGEAMMTGAAPVCLDNHDVALFIENGVNGFYSKDSEELADFLNHLCRNEASARKISAAARRTALDIFNHDRYLAAWTELLERTVR